MTLEVEKCKLGMGACWSRVKLVFHWAGLAFFGHLQSGEDEFLSLKAPVCADLSTAQTKLLRSTARWANLLCGDFHVYLRFVQVRCFAASTTDFWDFQVGTLTNKLLLNIFGACTSGSLAFSVCDCSTNTSCLSSSHADGHYAVGR
jgi:hypothetical protein